MYATVNSQVGVNNSSPQSMLDVNGDITLRNELKVGGTKTLAGNPGTDNQILVSQGDNTAPLWRTSKLNFYEQGEYRITGSNATTDEVGINFSNTSGGDNVTTSPIGQNITSANPAWTQIPGLATTFTVGNITNSINVVFQTGVEMSDIGAVNDQFIRFVCGVFIDDQLAALRADQINGVNGKTRKNQSIFTLNYVITNISPGTHSAKVACRRITSSAAGYHLAIGRTTTDGTQVASNFMLKSILKFDVSELVKIIY